MPLDVACRASDADKHNKDVTALLFHKGKLYSGSDDGQIKVWTADLIKEGEVQAHGTPVYGLAASDDSIYSCSSDGSIKAFELNTLNEKQALRKGENTEYLKIRYTNGHLYVGDNECNVHLFKNNQLFGTVNVAEPVKDLQILEPYVLTVQDTDLVVTEFKLDGEKIQWAQDISIPGRAPITLIGKSFIALIDRDGKEILLHNTDRHSGFKLIAKIVHGSENDRIINALEGVEWNGNQLLLSGGWDKIVKLWKVTDQGLAQISNVNVDLVINAIASGEPNSAYAGGTDGHIVRVDTN